MGVEENKLVATYLFPVKNTVISSNFHTSKLGEVTVFYVVQTGGFLMLIETDCREKSMNQIYCFK